VSKRRDLYEVLGVARDADDKTIQSAYRKLARELHPDVNPDDPGAEDRFKEVSQAYTILSDPEKRRDYDDFGDLSLESGFDREEARRAHEAFKRRSASGGGDYSMFFEPGDEVRFGDAADLGGIFGDLFGGGAGGRGRGGMRMRGADLEASVELSFMDALRGGERRLQLTRPKPDGGVETKTVTVRFPPGVADGDRLRVAGQGAPGVGDGPPGDLWTTIRVRPHPVFKREGRNLVIDVPISVREAILGAEVSIPTPDGRVKLRVPPGTSSGAKLRLRGKGVPGRKGRPAGDLIARIQIRVPKEIDDDAREALAQLERFEDPQIRKHLFEEEPV